MSVIVCETEARNSDLGNEADALNSVTGQSFAEGILNEKF